MHKYKKVIDQYIDGWRKADKEKILQAITEDVIIIESHGPVYKGKNLVEKWIEEWHKSNGKVLGWDITSYIESEDTVFFEWEFDYQYESTKNHISGSTIVKISDSKISYLREYRTTIPLFDYQ